MVSRSVSAVSVFCRAGRGRGILLASTALEALIGFVTFSHTMFCPILRRATGVRLMQRPHISVHLAALLLVAMPTVSPHGADAAADLADQDGNANGNGKEHEGETLADVS